jgi:hypothetical protein
LVRQDIISFEKADPTDEIVLKRFSQALFTIRDRHANTVPTMAEAVMEVKGNYATKGLQEIFYILFYAQIDHKMGFHVGQV